MKPLQGQSPRPITTPHPLRPTLGPDELPNVHLSPSTQGNLPLPGRQSHTRGQGQGLWPTTLAVCQPRMGCSVASRNTESRTLRGASSFEADPGHGELVCTPHPGGLVSSYFGTAGGRLAEAGPSSRGPQS